MRTVNTEKMDKVTYKGQEIAFGRCAKNEWNEYVVKVYVDGVYDEDKTIYADSREDAEATKAQAIKDYSSREEQRTTNKANGDTTKMTKAYMTAEQVKAIDFRNYRNLIGFLEKHCTAEQYENYKRLTVFNKKSIVFDKDFRFTFYPLDALENGQYNLWAEIDGKILYDYVDCGVADRVEDIPDMVKSVLWYIRTRI